MNEREGLMKKLFFAAFLALAGVACAADVDVKATLEALKTAEGDAKARLVVALTPHAENAKDALRAALDDASELVRIVAIRAAVVAKDERALPRLFNLCFVNGEDGRCAAHTMSVLTTPGTDAFLFEQMKKEGRGRAIELLSSRGNPELITRLCDAELYTDKGVSQAAAGAFRTCLQQPQFAGALAFAVESLTAAQREPLVTALGSVAQQLPDQARIVREIGACVAKVKPDAKAEVLGLLAGLQSEEACAVLTAQLKNGDVELRKAIVRVFSKWSSPLALAPLMASATDPDASVKALAFRNALTMLDKPGVASADAKLAALQKLAQVAERKEDQKRIYAAVKTLGGSAAMAYRDELAKTFDIQETETLVTAINIGGKETGAFKADTQIAGGHVYAVTQPIDLSDAADAAPESVYQSSRYQGMSCNLENLKPNAPYLLRLHFAELYHPEPGRRVCEVIVNGTKALENFDIVARAGKAFKAVTETLDVTSSADGKIAIEFKTVVDQVLVNGLELLEVIGAPAVPPVAINPADRVRVLILTGSNNHDWKTTTEALKTVLAANPRFAVSVTETPWSMKPADLAAYDVLFSNWNTWDKKDEERKQYEWNAEMKAAFLKWFTDGGGFFVLHAGSSMFYDWDEYQKLTAGTWGAETFHPHNQKFTLNIADTAHPITKGMTDFETFDEPWQKISNPNPNRHVLVSGVVSKENKGSGEVEPFAFVTETGKGCCFTLLLGHDAQMILNSPGCRTLILRGTEWAATGAVK